MSILVPESHQAVRRRSRHADGTDIRQWASAAIRGLVLAVAIVPRVGSTHR